MNVCWGHLDLGFCLEVWYEPTDLSLTGCKESVWSKSLNELSRKGEVGEAKQLMSTLK